MLSSNASSWVIGFSFGSRDVANISLFLNVEVHHGFHTEVSESKLVHNKVKWPFMLEQLHCNFLYILFFSKG